MNTEPKSRTTLTRDQLDGREPATMRPEGAPLDTVCARFATLRGADAAYWIATGERLGDALLTLGRALARIRARRRVERREADESAYGL
jgi:hypothetical protein